MPKMKMIAGKVINELVISFLNLFSAVTGNLKLQPVMQEVGKNDHKLLNPVLRKS